MMKIISEIDKKKTASATRKGILIQCPTAAHELHSSLDLFDAFNFHLTSYNLFSPVLQKCSPWENFFREKMHYTPRNIYQPGKCDASRKDNKNSILVRNKL